LAIDVTDRFLAATYADELSDEGTEKYLKNIGW
jgi:hypothetical protein